MNWKFVLIVIYSLNSKSFFSQVSDSIKIFPKYHSISAGIGMESLFYVQYKNTFKNLKYFHSNFIGGFGCAPGDAEGGLSSHYNIIAGFSQNIGFRPMFLTFGVAPVLHFYDNVSYINVNGIIGLKFEPKTQNGFIIEIGYLPTLFSTHKSDAGIPFYLGGGEVF